MDSDKRTRLIALLVTVAFHAAVVILLVCAFIRATPPGEQVWPPVDESELLLVGEYVMAGDIPEPGHAEEPAPQTAEEPAPRPEPQPVPQPPAATPPEPPASAAKSPMKVKEKKQPEISEEERRRMAEEKRRSETAKEISGKVSFGKSSSRQGTGTGHSGQADGNSASGALSGTPAANLRGRTLESWENPRGTEIGTIVVSVRVDRQGNVISAAYSSGTGTVAASQAARSSCIQAARRSRFSVDLDARAEQTGTITYRFR